MRETKMKRKVRAVVKKTRIKSKDVVESVVANGKEPAVIKRPRGGPRKYPMAAVPDANPGESSEKKEKIPKSKAQARSTLPQKMGLRKRECLRAPMK